MYRSDANDAHATSEWVHHLIAHAAFTDPPCREDEWNIRSAAVRLGTAASVFESLPKLAPQLLEAVQGSAS